jgi:putative transposase
MVFVIRKDMCTSVDGPCQSYGCKCQIRLPSDHYVGQRIYFVTICCEGRSSFFGPPDLCKTAIEVLRRVSVSMHFMIHAYCIMPDHRHILAEGSTPGSNLTRFVAKWKQSTGYLLRDEASTPIWQRRFYDHVLRKATNCEAVAWYIWMNPVRKGMVAEPEQYPFSGSFTVEWPKLAPADTKWLPPWKTEERTR